ncbi:replication-relaxation family protein [Streptomyces phaeochromogenes]|uniref:replication-relaxation family protein n=1 Tax=Streptomyces phaeochromogenes TaxID=1923 RepID=UPI00386D53AF|nr:replication-relaxation family protein [Streptomyces phaeochromogenes]
MGGSKAYPYGSTLAVRGHVLAALGVLKVASADQIHRLMAPGIRTTRRSATRCWYLARYGITVSESSSRDGNKLWSLTPHGLDAAAEALGRPADQMGGTARGAARSGAPHAMAVNETIIAITRTPAAPTSPVPRQRTQSASLAMAVGADALGPRGIGTVGSWSTEASLYLPSSRGTRTAVRADAVLQAPEAGLPVLFVEVDNCTETPERLAAKFEKYRTYFRLKTKTTQGRELPVWRSRYAATGRDGHPPVAVVFNPGTRMGPEGLKNRMNTVLQQTRDVWSGTYRWHGMYGVGEERDGYYDYADAIPVLFTTLDRLQADGPHAAVWRRCGHGQFEPLPDALANPKDHDAWAAREEARRRQRDAEREEQQQAWGVQRERWTQEPDLAPAPAPEPEPCERCGLPITGQQGHLYDNAPPQDGRHCPTCRTDLQQQPMTLRQALFGRPKT